jgi:septum formation protein
VNHGGIVLGSTSAARRAQLERLGLPFTVLAPEVDEDAIVGATPDETAMLRASAKAHDVLRRTDPGAVVIGADQLVDLDGAILGKPGTSERAVDQLARLSGRAHRLVTAVAVVRAGTPAQEHLDVTQLHMHPWDRAALQRYVAHDRPEHCAGSYRIEGQGIALFARIVGNDPTAIEGLPLGALAAMLRALGVQVP